MAPPRRRTDEEQEDYSRLRGGSPFNGHTKWVVTVVSSAIVGALAFLLAADRNGIERRLTAVEQLAISTAQSQKVHESEGDARWEEIKRTLERIEADVRAFKTRK